MKITTKFWIGLGALVALSPLGLLFPEYFKSTVAWGEWRIDEVRELVGYLPRGLDRLSRFWSAPIPDYAFKGWEGKSLASLSLAYIFSAFIGVLLCIGVVLILVRCLRVKRDGSQL